MPAPASAAPEWTDSERRRFLQALQEWSLTNGRMLPWRRCGDAYRVWISEIMLQQTTVVAVIPYFERFLARFPTLSSLAEAEEADVLRLWEGLGYYSRARNLHAAAKQLVMDHAGILPREVARLLLLPGIGRYTAGAIASFAFDEPAPIVEANTQRLYARLLGETGELQTTAVNRRLWAFATELVQPLPATRTPRRAEPFPPGEINQALMDLGAVVCTPQSPDCEHCPVQAWCRARQLSLQSQIPRLKPRPVMTDVTDATVVVQHGNRVLLRQRGTGERWAGLWDFPRVTLEEDEAAPSRLTALVAEQAGLAIQIQAQLPSIRHTVTRYRIELRCFLAVADHDRLPPSPELRWQPISELHAVALSMTGRKLALRVQEIVD